MSCLSKQNLSEMSVKELLCTILTDNLVERLFDIVESLVDLSRASYEEFTSAGLSKSEIQQIKTVLELSTRYWSQQSRVSKITGPMDCYKLLEPLMRNLEQEIVRLILLDENHNVLATPVVTIGTLDSSLVHPREVFKYAIRDNATAIVMAHQHPSGDPTPSNHDFQATERIVRAGKILGVEVVDHIILGFAGKYFSFLENGQL